MAMSGGSKSSQAAAAYRARWIIPVDRPPFEGGLVTVAGSRIVAVGENTSGQPPRDLGDVALLPGLVNAHTHLEFSLLEKPLGSSGMSFPEWIRLVVEHRRQQAKSLMVETDGYQRFRRRAATAGLSESRSAGIGAVGDVATPGWPRECFPAEGLDATIFLELLGLNPQREEGLLAMAQSFVLDLQDAPRSLRPGISPHAPYTVSPKLVGQVCRLSRSERFPVAMHVAESREELELLANHTGPLVQVLQSLEAWHATAVPKGSRPIDYFRLLAEAHRALVIHANYVDADAIDFLAGHRERMSVIYCPRTHAFFRHEPYPLEKMLAAGVRVAIGTDSRASNPDLRLFEELRHIAAQHPGVAPEAILRMGTLAGAEALGIADQYGTITPGKRACLAVVPVSQAGSPWETLFEARTARPGAIGLEDFLGRSNVPST
jgi:cytosine/adenosine deaminase-related metal-dependent hydrolase